MRYGVVGNTALKRPVKPLPENTHKQNSLRYGSCGKAFDETGRSAKKKKPSASARKAKLRTIKAESLGQVEIEERILRNKYARKNLANTFLVLLCVGLVAFAFASILQREAELLELHYSNIRLENEIKDINDDINDLSEELVKLYDPEEIRETAVRDLRMRKPAASQIITIKIPKSDKIFTDYEESSILDNSLDRYFENLEGFFKTFR